MELANKGNTYAILDFEALKQRFRAIKMQNVYCVF